MAAADPEIRLKCHIEILTSSIHCLAGEQGQGPFQPSGFTWKPWHASLGAGQPALPHVGHSDSAAEKTNPALDVFRSQDPTFSCF